VVLIGYFVLGPQELYKLTKEIGSFVTQFRESGAQATAALTESLEDDFQVNEIRKATDELTGAFSFRRSINYDDTMADAAEEVGVAAAAKQAVEEKIQAEGGAAPVKKKKIRRRIRKKAEPEPEPEPEPEVAEGAGADDDLLYAPDADADDDAPLADEDVYPPYASTYEENLPMPPWDTGDGAAESTEDDDSLDSLKARRRARLEAGLQSSEPTPDASSRFAQQLSGNWNDRVLANEDALSPLATVMERLALLEEERGAIQRRLEEEFRERAGVDEEFYRKKRRVLEGAAAEVQMGAYGDALNTNGDAEPETVKPEDSWWGGGEDAAAGGTARPADRVGSGSYLDSL